MQNQFKKILILRFGAIGDVIHSTPLFRSIKQACPRCEIHYATFKTPSLNIQNDPDLEKVWIIEGKSYKNLICLANELRHEKFDLFINLQPSIKTKIFGLLLRARKTLVYKKTFKLHAVKNFWITAKPLFPEIELPEELKIYVNKEALERIKEFLESQKLLNKKLIVFNTGTSNARQGRKWSLESWKKLAELVLKDPELGENCEIILTGAEEDREFAEKISLANHKIHSFCGKLNLQENTALLSLCNIFISGDTGPLHIASAVGAYAIGIYGAAPINRTGVYGKNGVSISSKLPCVPCNKRKCRYLKKGEETTPCLQTLDTKEVFEEMKKYLIKPGGFEMS